MIARSQAVLLLLVLAACSGQPGIAETGSPGSSTETASVICDAFAEGGPVDLTTQAVIANLEGENPAQLAREAIEGYEDLAGRAAGEERDDLLALASAMDDAELSGEGVMGWNAASEAFYVKHAEQCGAELAP